MKIPVCVLIFCLAAIASKAQPTLTQQPTNQIVNNGGTVSFSVAAGGTGPFTYQWRLNATNLPAPGIITTVAGGGVGDGFAATNAALNYPTGVAVDRLGNLFIADQNNNRIRKVGANGIITTVAGNGTQGFSGDGSAATNANLAFPSGVTVDTIGNLFIADYSNQRIRKVDTSGIITTVAGNGNYDFTGDGGAATNAALRFPFGVAMDGGGNLFVADRYNQRIRKVDTNGIITTVAGNGSHDFSGDGGAATNAGLLYPFGVALNGFENLFIADLDNRRVRAVDNSGVITTVAGNGTFDVSGDGGAATNAGVSPSSVAVDDAGDLFISDISNDRIRKVNGPSSQLPVLVLNNVTPSAAGDYDVVVSNSSGSVTSLVATLTVVSPLPLRFISPGLSNNQFNALLTGTIGGGYVIQVSSNLAVSSWSPIATGAIPQGGSIAITDAVSTSQSQKFYRAVSSP